MPARELQRVLVRLKPCADGIVEIRCSRLFDVCAKYVRDDVIGRKGREATGALPEGDRVSDVETSRVHRVSGEQEAGAPIVERDGRPFMSGNRDDVHQSAAEIEGRHVVGPVVNAKELRDVLWLRSNHGRVWQRGKLRVSRYVIAVRVGVGHDERGHLAAMTIGPALQRVPHGAGDVGILRSAIEQESPPVAEQQIQERLLVVGAAGLAKNEQIGVVLVQVKVRPRLTPFARLWPARPQGAALETCSIRLWRLRKGGRTGRYFEGDGEGDGGYRRSLRRFHQCRNSGVVVGVASMEMLHYRNDRGSPVSAAQEVLCWRLVARARPSRERPDHPAHKEHTVKHIIALLFIVPLATSQAQLSS